MPNREKQFWIDLLGLDVSEKESAAEDEEDDEWFIKLLQERHTPPVAVPGRVSSPKTVRPPLPKPPVRVSLPDNISRRQMSDLFNEELRSDYKEGPKARGDKHFDQSKKSKDFKRTEKFTKDSPGKVKQIDPKQPTHKSRKLHREMRARTKGGQFKNQKQLQNYLRAVESGYKHGKKMRGALTAAEAASLGLRNATRLAGPANLVMASGYGGYKLGKYISGFTPAGKRQAARERDWAIRRKRTNLAKQLYPGQSESFYLGLVNEMFAEEHRGDEISIQDLTDAVRMMQKSEDIKQ